MLTSGNYRHVLYALDACNLSGIIHDWSTIMVDIWEEALSKGEGTDYVNRHPICILLSEKVRELAGGDFSEAYRIAKERATTQGRDTDPTT